MAGDLNDRLAAIALVSFDVDGVLTDGRLYYTEAGDEIKAFNVQDGAAIKLLLKHGIDVALITGRQSAIVARRALELGIRHVYQGVDDKTAALADLAAVTGIDPGAMAHVGDDLPDIALFRLVGVAISVADGHPLARDAAALVTRAAGGRGVARELAQVLLEARRCWPPDDI